MQIPRCSLFFNTDFP